MSGNNQAASRSGRVLGRCSAAGAGAFVTLLADGGVGTENRAHLAGQIPGASIPNTCNDN